MSTQLLYDYCNLHIFSIGRIFCCIKKLIIRQYVVLTDLTVYVYKVHCTRYLLKHMEIMINMNVTRSNKMNIYHCKLNSCNEIGHVRSCLLSNLQFGSCCTINLDTRKIVGNTPKLLNSIKKIVIK